MFSIDRKLLALRTKYFVKRNKVERNTVSIAKANNIGIIFCTEDKEKHSSINRFAQKLTKEGKSVKVICYLGAGKENHDFRFDYFTRKDLSFWGKFTSPLVDDFLATNYDFLFSIDTKSNFLIDSILARAKAKCRIGLYQEKHNEFLEMMLKVEELKNIDKIIDQMYHYTTELQKK